MAFIVMLGKIHQILVCRTKYILKYTLQRIEHEIKFISLTQLKNSKTKFQLNLLRIIKSSFLMKTLLETDPFWTSYLTINCCLCAITFLQPNYCCLPPDVADRHQTTLHWSLQEWSDLLIRDNSIQYRGD